VTSGLRGVICIVMLAWLPAIASAEPTWRDAADLASDEAAARRLLYFTATWCGPCRLVEREVFDHPEGQAELAHYDLIHVDLDSPAGQALSERFRVANVPTFVVLDSLGAEVDRVRGYRSRRLLLRDLGRFRRGDGTLGDLRQRLDRNPDDPALQAALGLRHHERLELDVAADLLRSGLIGTSALDDTLAAEAGRALADLHRRQGDEAAAARVLQQLLREHPTHLYPRATWQLLAACHATLADSVAEAEALRGAAQVSPPRTGSLLAFAWAAARVSRYLDDAEAAAREAVALTDRADPEAQAALAAVLRRRRVYAEALMWIKRAMALAPEELRWREQWQEIRSAAIRGD